MSEQLALAACSADAVVVGTLAEPLSFLTEDARFILTSYSLTPTESLRGSLEAGLVVSYARPGGKVKVGGRIVRASSEYFGSLELDTPYLLFLHEVPGADGTYTPIYGERWLVNAVVMLAAARAIGPVARFELRNGTTPDAVRSALASIDCG